MSECHKFEADLSALIDGELPGERQAEVIDHVDHCPQCSRRVTELQKLATGLAALPKAVPAPQFVADVRRKLREDGPAAAVSWFDRLFRPVWPKVPLEALAVVMVVAGVFILVRPAAPKPAASAEPARRVRAQIMEEQRDDRAAFAENAHATGTSSEAVGLSAQTMAGPESATLSAAPSAPPAPSVAGEARAEAFAKALPVLPEPLVVRGDSVVNVRSRAENFARQYQGHVSDAVPSNSFMVFLPPSKVESFRAQVAGTLARDKGARRDAGVMLGAAAKSEAPREKESAPEPLIGLSVVVEP